MNKLITISFLLIIYTAVTTEAIFTGTSPQHKDDRSSFTILQKTYESCAKPLRSDLIEKFCNPTFNGHLSDNPHKHLLCFAYFDVIYQLCDKKAEQMRTFERSQGKTVCDDLNTLYKNYTAKSELQEQVKVIMNMIRDPDSCKTLCTADEMQSQMCLFLVKANQNLILLANSTSQNIRHDTSHKQNLNIAQKDTIVTNQSEHLNANRPSQDLVKLEEPETNADKEIVQPKDVNSNLKDLKAEVVTNKNNCNVTPKAKTQGVVNADSNAEKACTPNADINTNNEESIIPTDDFEYKTSNPQIDEDDPYILQNEEQSEPERPILKGSDLQPDKIESEQAIQEPKKDQSNMAQDVNSGVKDKSEGNDNVEIIGKEDKSSGTQLVPPVDNVNEELNDAEGNDNESVGLHAQLDSNPYFEDTKKQAPNDFKPAPFIETEDSHLFVYLLCGMAICVLGYIIVHNKNKLLAIIVEGRRGSGSRGGRRRHTASYRKLDCNIEEAITSTGRSDFSQVIY